MALGITSFEDWAHVHVVVGMYQSGAALPSHYLRCPVGDDLVGIGVGGGAGACLEYVHDELVVELAVGHFLGGFHDSSADVTLQQSQTHVVPGSRQLDKGQGTDEAAGESEVADGEIKLRPSVWMRRSRRLWAPP